MAIRDLHCAFATVLVANERAALLEQPRPRNANACARLVEVAQCGGKRFHKALLHLGSRLESVEPRVFPRINLVFGSLTFPDGHVTLPQLANQVLATIGLGAHRAPAIVAG